MTSGSSKSYPTAPSWVLMIGIVALMAAFQAAMPQTGEWLRYERGSILGGELWRLISGHFVHLTWSHYGMNALALLLLSALFPRLFKPGAALLWYVCLATGISVCMLIFKPELIWYVGFSGVLHGLLIAGAITDIRFGYRLSGGVLLVLVLAKLGYEAVYGALPGSEATAGGPVVEEAHLYGAGCGLLMVGMWFLWEKLVRMPRSHKELSSRPER